MKLLLDIKCYVIDGHPYYRVHFSTKQARSIGLQKGDKLLIEILEHRRPEFNNLELKETKLTEAIS